VSIVRTDVSEERIASIIRVNRIIVLGTTLAVTSLSCKVSGFHGSYYEEFSILGCYAVWLL
jgi:hypothetical protein